MSLISTNSTIIGSKVKVKRGSKINSITVKLGNTKSGIGPGTTGRHLGLAYWVIDEDFNKQNMKINPSTPNMHWFDNVSSRSISGYNTIRYNDGQSYKYVNTNLIAPDTSESVTFYFNNQNEITENEIFVALIATRGLTIEDFDDVKYAWTCYDAKQTGVAYCKITPVDSDTILTPNSFGAINVVNVDATLPSNDADNNLRNKPAPIRCTRLSYRTWSALVGTEQSGSVGSHQASVCDGGETCGYLYDTNVRSTIINKNRELTVSGKKILPYIMNDGTSGTFEDDFRMPLGRLSDVEFDRPSEGGLTLSGNSITQPRWCFKRSRIKFEIPGISNANYGTVVQYLVKTPISEKGIYSIEPKSKFYTKEQTRNGFSIVICPRDEGVLDNMRFEVIFSRQYANSIRSKIGSKSNDSIYKFHTYQKPIVNITYPKMIRNASTWNENGTETRNFKYAKIPTSNIYSTFDGEQAYRNKYVCDALNILFSTSKNDDSGIPMFVRFYVAEFKYGRDGCIAWDSNGKPYSTAGTSQDLFKSHDRTKYTSLNDILNGTAQSSANNYKTAEITNIFNNDGSPLLLSGKFNARTLKEIGENYHLWTFNTWDSVVEDDAKDVQVFNSWQLTKSGYNADGSTFTKVISKDIVGDHKNKGIIRDIDAEICEYPVSKMLLFRAGYCYLIRIRMFHGAAAGAISRKYGRLNETCIGKEGTGDYSYAGSVYNVSYPLNDGPQHGNSNPYNKWIGPDDGTAGLSLIDNNLNETFPGFSQVDYSIFEATAPYTSMSNLISVHPTSPNVSVNQCLSFNYRHLAKAIGTIDTTVFDGTSSQSGYFGRTFSGIHNTATRIMEMYTTCVETILSKYFGLRGTQNTSYYNEAKMGIGDRCNGDGADSIRGTSEYQITSEMLTLKIKPIDGNGRLIDNGNNVLTYIQADPKEFNVPLINKYDVSWLERWAAPIDNPADPTAMTNRDFYTHNYTDEGHGISAEYNGRATECGCYQYNKYRQGLLASSEAIRLNSSGNHVSNPYKLYGYENPALWLWPEFNIIYKTLQVNTSGELKEEPLGNIYRWQPVINAVHYDDNVTKEIQIQNNADNITLCNNNKNSQPNSLVNGKANGASVNSEGYLYNGSNTVDGNIQTAYFYQDITTATQGSHKDMSNCDTTGKKNRFTINEFGGVITGKTDSPGYPVMQTMPSTESKHYKYFDLNNTLKTYGELFKRVPTSCDCENGIVTSNTINFGSLGRFKDTGIANNNELYSLDTNGTNVFPLVRTTHYLFFKTHINTAFTLQADVTVKYTSADGSGCTETTNTSADGTTTVIHNHGRDLIELSKSFFMTADCTAMNEGSEDNKDYIITFGNKNGVSEVYAEDNNGWGRCLSADDVTNMQLKADGGMYALSNQLSATNCVDASKVSGGIEVPLLVRYTPLLQPKLVSEKIGNKTYDNVISKNVTIKEDRYHNASKVLFNYGDDEIETASITLNINYPYIPEDETYTTRNINGGLSGNVWLADYHVDNDTDTPNDRNVSTNATNMDFLGGYGICTGYTVLLVPSDPNLSKLKTSNYDGYTGNKKYLTDDEITKYFKNTDGHWNYFNQPNNYYKSGHIYGVRSKSQSEAGPVLVAYNAQTNKVGEFLSNSTVANNGRNNQGIDLNINNLRKCKVYYKNSWIDCNTFNNKNDVKAANIKLDKNNNKLNTGLIYDLVIIPVYSNETDKSYNWTKSAAGTINSQPYGSTKDTEGDVHFAGSNPLVIFNYLQVNANIIDNSGGGGDDDDRNPVDIYKIHNTDGGIVFPNVDHKLFNQTTGEVKESPGFWLNNSFKLVLRLPSFRTKHTIINDVDNATIENASNGMLDSDNNDTANDFMFNDIQIHIGKIEELNAYGYPDNMETNLNKITDKDELARLHIISYQHYYADDVFSKRLNNQLQDDERKLATGGSLNPDDANYKNRFIEVNLTNVTIKDDNGNDVPIYTKYPEGFYIQFRTQTAYATDKGNYSWSPWYGGSIDGGARWWGSYGTDYYVPVRNYSEIFTDFRNYIKESYPGSNIKFGKGSLLSWAGTDESSKSRPLSAIIKSYYKQGSGNTKNCSLVGSETINATITECSTKELNDNQYRDKTYDVQKDNDWPYKGNEKYKTNHDKNWTLDNDKSRMWEMLYVDYIIRNMSKLYYKPNYNNVNDQWNGSDNRSNYLKYHLSVPYENNRPIILDAKTWGWDDTEYNLFKTNDNDGQYNNLNNQLVLNEDKSSIDNHINGPRKKYTDNKGYWDLNKYYRKPITKNDFDELNNHLIDLTTFIRHSVLSGLDDTTVNKPIVENALSIKPELLEFDRTRKAIIGNSAKVDDNCGIGIINNITNQLTDCNYIQKIWDNIKLLCQCENDSIVEL